MLEGEGGLQLEERPPAPQAYQGGRTLEPVKQDEEVWLAPGGGQGRLESRLSGNPEEVWGNSWWVPGGYEIVEQFSEFFQHFWHISF